MYSHLLTRKSDIKKQKFKCSKTEVKKRASEKTQHKKRQNSGYYIRRKWGISLTRDPLSKILDVLLARIPGAKVDSLATNEAQLNARLLTLNRK
ncbi:hypothetical protein PC116_g24804 [Phytophthora cactorum]|uniref:Uncharacterized protein n=1 Tax=Phytophthora cactorum TaxID=29920 RepID=A0A8T1BE13_9STRA|nr:hypothetical protein Pcac1_g16393 [Phytophthora cactorum]KAG2813580.1 hypothetical protein PC111_g14323 [Phytophthora cactorum]KAG2828473.1 hypothetical protein PC112_g8458 [Phytophthora cactorum]KAG2855039.1 hypothetical protein PC113_g12790 [Phytophthora cactorum]KAG2898261.1 hypothetical protein PC117_g22603 [Phytophthora cactorum]